MAAAGGGRPPPPADPALDACIFKQGDPTNRGIPEAIFIENVEALCEKREPTDVVAKLQELHSKYQYMQSSLVAQRAGLKTKLPDITSAKEVVAHLVDKRNKLGEGETTSYTYQLSENIYTKAEVPPQNNVCLWLGANCMLEYTLDEATELLATNETNAKTTLKSLDQDMVFLRDQITTTEVNIARCHNFGVKQRAKAKEGGSGDAAALPAPAGRPAAAGPAGSATASGGNNNPKGFKFSWTQTNEEVEVSVPVAKGAQKSDVSVAILADSIKVEHAGTVLLEGQFFGKCRPGGSTWTMGAKRIEVTLEKADKEQWPSFFESSE